MKRILSILFILVLCTSFVFAQTTQISPVEDFVSQAIAWVVYGLIGMLVYLVNRFLKIMVTRQMVEAHIAEKIIEVKDTSLSNEAKKNIVVEAIAQTPKMKKLTKLIYGSLGAAVDIVYQNIIKKRK